MATTDKQLYTNYPLLADPERGRVNLNMKFIYFGLGTNIIELGYFIENTM